MDVDADIASPIDPFSTWLPLPFRVAILLVLGIWAWGSNLHYLHLIKINVPALIHYPSRTSPAGPSHYLSTYRLATILTIPLVFCLVLFWTLSSGSTDAARRWEAIPNLYLFTLVVTFFVPLAIFSRTGRYRTLSILRRISIGGLAEADNGKFGDVLMADALTSYAKVLGDLFVAQCLFWSSERSSTGTPDRSCGGAYAAPLVIAIPYLIRLRQCLIDYVRVRDANAKAGRIGLHGWGGQHIANALKYASAFPVIILSALQRSYYVDAHVLSDVTLFRLWHVLFFVLVNSFYSFYWDVAKDWDLSLFSDLVSSKGVAPDHPFGLRRHRFIHAQQIYYTVIVVDFLLRCTWSFKLSPHLDHFNDLEGGIFLMELLEVFRRWIWIFFRVETEWGEILRNHRASLGNDVLLGSLDLDASPSGSDDEG